MKLCTLIMLCSMMSACVEAKPVISPPPPDNPSASQTQPKPHDDSDEDGLLDVFERVAGSQTRVKDTPCVLDTYELDIEVKPKTNKLDFIVLVDTSGSMYQEIARVRAGLFTYFKDILQRQDLDVRLILIAEHPNYSPQEPEPPQGLGICLGTLLGQECDGSPPRPHERILHYDHPVFSTDTLKKMLDTMNSSDPHGLAPGGWYGRLRKEALPIIINITDDRSSMTQRAFETQLRNMDRKEVFYKNGDRRFTWHSVTGITSPPNRNFWEPADNLLEKRCETAAVVGQEYQRLSRLTSGLRFSLCKTVDYRAVFDTITTQTVQNQGIPCAILQPVPTASGVSVSPTSVALQLQLGDGKPALLERVSGTNQCHDRAFYTGQTFSQQYLYLCPQLCSQLELHTRGTLHIGADCLDKTCRDTLTHLSCQQ